MCSKVKFVADSNLLEGQGYFELREVRERIGKDI